MTGAAITVLALAEPFIAAGAAVAFWFFFATEKELGPRGYERNEIIHAWLDKCNYHKLSSDEQLVDLLGNCLHEFLISQNKK